MSDRPLRSLGTKMARFAVVGLANTVIDLAAFSVLLWLSMPPLAANVGAWFVAVLFSFAANGLWSFERDRSIPLGNAFFRFISLGALISLGVSSLSIAALAGWTAFLMTQIDWSVPVLSLLPVAESWVDVVVGEPAGADFFCLRANRKSLPLTEDVPYQITPALQQAVASVYDGEPGGGLPARSIFSRKPTGAGVNALLSRRDALRSEAGAGLFKKFRTLLSG